MPALGALAADPLVSLVDTAFVGRVGTVELGALGIVVAIFGLLFSLFNFLAYGTTPLVAGAISAGDEDTAIGFAKAAVRQALVLGIATALLVEMLAGPFLRLMQAGPELIDPAIVYLRIRALALPALLVVTAGHGVFRGRQDTRTPLYVTLALNAVNLALDPLLIFGFGWGLAGAAVATVIAQWVGAAWFLLLLRRWWTGSSRRVKGAGRRLGAAGRALVVRTAALTGVLTMATSVAARFGTEVVAAHQIASQVWLLLALVLDALAIAAQAMVGAGSGRLDDDDVWAIARRLLAAGFAAGTVIGLALFGFGGGVARLFSDDPAVWRLVADVMPLVALMQPAAALVFVGDGIFIGASEFGFLRNVTVVAAVVAAGVLFIVAGAGWGLPGVWVAITSLIVVRLLGMVWGIRRRRFQAAPGRPA